MTEDTWKDIAHDAIALLNEWDQNIWDAQSSGSRVMDADLADLYRRLKALEPQELPYR